MGSKGKQEEKAEKIDEMTYNERVDIDYVINLLKTTVSVPSERLKTCSIGLEDWKGQNGIWGNRGKNCKKLYPKAWLGDQQKEVRIINIQHLGRAALWNWHSEVKEESWFGWRCYALNWGDTVILVLAVLGKKRKQEPSTATGVKGPWLGEAERKQMGNTEGASPFLCTRLPGFFRTRT